MALVPGTAYPSQTDVDPAYPQGKARNAGTFNDGTGTPLEKRWVNDVWGFLQSLLAYAGITPSGAPDQVGASDYLTATKALAVREAKLAFDPNLMRLREINLTTPFTDNAASMGVCTQSNGPVMLLKAGATDSHSLSQHDDLGTTAGTVTSITSLVTDIAKNGARMVAIGTGGNRCCFTTDFGANWSAGSDLGATPERIIYNSTHSRFMVTFAAGVNVAQDVDGASTWASVSSGLATAQGGIAHFSNGDTVVCGYSGGSAVEMARSTNGGGAWSATATVPNPTDYADSGTIVGNGGTTIYHAGRTTANRLRICKTTSAMSWSLLADIQPFATLTFKPRILLCPDTGVLVVVFAFSGGTQAVVSRDGGVTWSDRVFYRTRFNNSFGIARGRLFATAFNSLYATDFLN
jgi:hypothetical protein